jgi:inosine triphosphate pyrophosphatase
MIFTTIINIYILQEKIKMIFVSSNQHKIQEVKKILPNIKIEKGKDLREVDSNKPYVIVMYKAKEAGKNYLVEDVVMKINGILRNDIKWIHKNLKLGAKVEWIVTYGYNNGEYIFCYDGHLKGVIVEPRGKSNFGFDMVFQPSGVNKTLAELNNEGKKEKFSARYIALQNVKKNKFFKKIKITEIKEWKGLYQNE